ncbi:LLM class flavin-dependent oxidoreductase [Solirubrobacter ginsenosidimutans]|uniref:LLM class flavin-dependent oxidoreductase n=1 Tax=Solirubrobacter ginsenosidimutans TaxID=490573 RepID=A0A9X3S493_9ACTN|nr:LLM class flavin-dependent oxidoreductase [Solirubrobacter ginsenosidimutans]MDA0160363.1 LLM class flavin-dependent oxidoreductase [Solirubrobacter ginsenosidimutans]
MELSATGVAFTPFETRVDTMLRLARHAEALGFGRVQVAEAWSHDATIVLAEMAAQTSRIGLGTGVLSVWGRTPASIALAAAGLQRASAGRFSLGLGAGSQPLTEGLHGVRWERPVAHLRETLTGVRALLAGERLPRPAAGAKPLRLGVVPDVPVPIALAALADESIRVAGELADEWAPFLWARSRLAEGRALLDEGEARAELPHRTHITAAVPVALGPDTESARRLAAWWLSTYTTRMGPIYPRLLERFSDSGTIEALQATGQEWPATAEQLAREVTLFGTYDEGPGQIDAWAAAGADSVALVLPPGRPEAELTELLEVVAASNRAATLG